MGFGVVGPQDRGECTRCPLGNMNNEVPVMKPYFKWAFCDFNKATTGLPVCSAIVALEGLGSWGVGGVGEQPPLC